MMGRSTSLGQINRIFNCSKITCLCVCVCCQQCGVEPCLKAVMKDLSREDDHRRCGTTDGVV